VIFFLLHSDAKGTSSVAASIVERILSSGDERRVNPQVGVRCVCEVCVCEVCGVWCVLDWCVCVGVCLCVCGMRGMCMWRSCVVCSYVFVVCVWRGVMRLCVVCEMCDVFGFFLGVWFFGVCGLSVSYGVWCVCVC